MSLSPIWIIDNVYWMLILSAHQLGVWMYETVIKATFLHYYYGCICS